MTGDNLRKTRTRKLRMTQTRLAEVLGYKSYHTILRLENRGHTEIPSNVAVSVTMLAKEKKEVRDGK